MNLTSEQSLVVETTGKNLLVSASAGSGKTHTMIERVFYLLTKKDASLKKMLIVTFTNASALEMKTRIKERILKQVNEYDFLKNELEFLPMADISTVHTFCSKLVKQYFYEVGIDPASKVVEDEESTFLKNESLTEILNQYIEKEDDLFNTLFETYNKKRRDNELKQSILNLYYFLKTKNNYIDFVNSILEKTYTTNLDKNISAIYLNNEFLELVSHFKLEFEKLHTDASMQKSEKLLKVTSSVLGELSKFKKGNSFLENANAFYNMQSFASMPSKVSSEEEDLKLQIDKEKSALTNALKKPKEYFGDSIESLQNALSNASINLKKMLELVICFDENYQKRKKEKAVLDFNDLEHYTLKILENETIKKTIQEQYDYVFIDEYQDINPLQEAILQKIVKENNAFMVGDIKQSIYRFRESDPEIFVQKYNTYQTKENSEKIDLNENFRSEKAILEFSNFIFSNIMKSANAKVDYKNTARFKASAPYEKPLTNMPLVGISILNKPTKEKFEKETLKTVYSVVEHINSLKENKNEIEDNVILESRIIANKISHYLNNKIYDVKTKEYRNVKFSDIAILTRVKTDFKTIKNELESYSIPVKTQYKETIYDTYEASLIHSYLNLINNECDDISLFMVLTSHMFKFTYDEMSEIRICYPKAQYFYEAINEYKKEKTDIISTKLQAFYTTLNEHKESLTYISIAELIRKIINEFDLENYFFSLPNGLERIANIKMIIAISEKEEYNNNIFTYLNEIESFKKEESFEINVSSRENSVTLSTIHSSKGLEYPIVILVNTGRLFYYKPKQQEIITNKDFGFGIKYYNIEERTKQDTLTRNAITIKNNFEELAEEMRLLYVALTRAKNHLWLIGDIDLNQVKTLESTYSIKQAQSYLAWILGSLPSYDLNALKMGKNKIDVKLLDDITCNFEIINLDLLKENETKTLPIISKSSLELENVYKKVFNYVYPYEKEKNIAIKSSVTEIMQKEIEEEENYSIKAFLTNEVYNKKDETDFSLIGTMYHKVMQYISFNCQTIEEVKNEIESLIKEKLVTENVFNFVNLDDILVAIKEIKPLLDGAKTVKKEEQFIMYVPYNEVLLGTNITDKILVQGVIDLIIEKENEIIVLDYKTSRLKENDLKTKYATQLKLYEMAYEKAYMKKQVKKVIYSFHLNRAVNV